MKRSSSLLMTSILTPTTDDVGNPRRHLPNQRDGIARPYTPDDHSGGTELSRWPEESRGGSYRDVPRAENSRRSHGRRRVRARSSETGRPKRSLGVRAAAGQNRPSREKLGDRVALCDAVITGALTPETGTSAGSNSAARPGQLGRSQTHQQRPRRMPRARLLIDPTAPSSASITPSRSTNSRTATMPEIAVNDTSGAPIRTRCPDRFPPRTLPTRWVSFPG